VVVEQRPGRIEAVVLAPGAPLLPQPGEPADATRAPEIDDPVRVRAEIEAAVRAANRTLAVHQRVAGWRLWPDADFPRTHTFKVQRDRVRVWAVIDEPLPVREDGEPVATAKGGAGRTAGNARTRPCPTSPRRCKATEAAAWQQDRTRSAAGRA